MNADEHNPTLVDSNHLLMHPDAKWMARPPLEGEWHNFRIHDPVRALAALAAEAYAEACGHDVEFRIAVFFLDGLSQPIRWPATFHPTEPEEKQIRTYLPNDGNLNPLSDQIVENEVAIFPPKYLHEILSAIYSSHKEEIDQTSSHEIAKCEECEKKFEHADVVIHALDKGVLCEDCFDEEELERIAVGLFVDQRCQEDWTPEMKEKFDSNFARVNEMRQQQLEDENCPLQ